MRVLVLLVLLLPILSFGSPEEDKRFFKETQVEADLGNAYMQYKLGLIYYLGTAVPKDDKEAVTIELDGLCPQVQS